MLIFTFFELYLFTIRLISSGRARLVHSDGKQVPADFRMSERAAANNMFGSVTRSLVPKSEYMFPFFVSFRLCRIKKQS